MYSEHSNPPPAPPAQGQPALFVILWKADEALRLASAFPGARIALFVDSWSDVDHARRRAAEAGAADRLSVHHAAARHFFRN